MKYILITILAMFSLSCAKKEEVEKDNTAEVNSPGILTSNKVKLNGEQVRLANIETGSLKQQIISDFVECSGNLSLPPQHVMTITPPIGGFVKSVKYLPGDFVKKGSLLATLTHQDYISLQQTYLQTSAQFTFAEQEYQRQKQLAEGDAAARKNLEQKAAEYASLKAELMGLSARLRFIGINPARISQKGIQSSIAVYAPSDAFISQININPGKYVSEQTALYELINTSHIHLGLNVFEKDIASIEKGQKVYYRLNKDDQLYEGKVMLIGQNMNSEHQAFDIHVELTEKPDFFKPGMFVQAKIFLQSDSVTVVPEAAVVRKNDRKYIFVQEGNEFVREEIKTGATADNMVEIVNPVSLIGKMIVIKGAYYLEAELNK